MPDRLDTPHSHSRRLTPREMSCRSQSEMQAGLIHIPSSSHPTNTHALGLAESPLVRGHNAKQHLLRTLLRLLRAFTMSKNILDNMIANAFT